MFAQLYMETQAHGGDIQYLFSHKTRKAKPSIFRRRGICGRYKFDIGPGCSCNYFGKDSINKYCKAEKSKDFL